MLQQAEDGAGVPQGPPPQDRPGARGQQVEQNGVRQPVPPMA